MAFAVMLHQQKTDEQLLTGIIARETGLEVATVSDGMTIRTNRVYVAPPQRELRLLGDEFQLFDLSERDSRIHPIDVFFRSLAGEMEDRAVGIVLSGTGTDGSVGIKEINAHNGIIITQSEESAKFTGMPQSAVRTGLVDYVLSPKEMPGKLLELKDSSPGIPPDPEEAEEEFRDGDLWLSKIYTLLKQKNGHDFRYYKKNTLLRRIRRRMHINQVASKEEYVRILRHHDDELDSLFSELLIGVTSFFRELESFEALRTAVLPEMIRQADREEPLRIWVPACSTGEEAYSLSILILECMEEIGTRTDFQIFASDVDEKAVEKARWGTYPETIETDISADRLRKFFSKSGNTYQVKGNIREPIIFSVQNLLRNPPFSKIDLISCRNFLIYLNADAQQKVLATLHFALKKKGVLMLGISENIGRGEDLFEPIDKKQKIFRAVKKGGSQPRVELTYQSAEHPPTPKGRAPERSGKAGTTQGFRLAVHGYLLSSVTPAAVFFDKGGMVTYFHGDTDKFLTPPSGMPSNKLSDMIRVPLLPDFKSALRQVKKEKCRAVRRKIPIKLDGEYRCYDMTLEPVKSENEDLAEQFVMVFSEVTKPEASEEQTAASGNDEALKKEVEELKQEIKEVQENHDAVVEELETSNEEGKSMNEELQSANEELQSTNEELESSKEELQSLNEELITVNNELQSKVDELSDTRDDLTNLLNSTDTATLFLDRDIKIRRITPRAEEMFNIIPSDAGRPLHHFSSRFDYENLGKDITKVFDTLNTVEEEIRTTDGDWYLLRINPYRTKENYVDGAVMSFFEITEQKRTREKLEEYSRRIETALQFSERIIELVEEPLVVLDRDLKISKASDSFVALFGLGNETISGRKICEIDERFGFLEERLREAEDTVENFSIPFTTSGDAEWEGTISVRLLNLKEPEVTKLLLIFQENND